MLIYMKSVYDKLKISKEVLNHTKQWRKPPQETVKDLVPPYEDYNFQMDILELPKTKKGYNRLLVLVDLANDEIDFEPMKTKTPKEVLAAMKTIFNRPYLNKPYASIRTDKGSEFKGVVKDYLYNESILHTTAEPGRHKQISNIESANKQIGKTLNLYMNSMLKKLDLEDYNEWTDILPELRKELNKYRKKPLTPIDDSIYRIDKQNKFCEGDYVKRKLDRPHDIRGYVQNTENFRAGDITVDFIPRKIIKVLSYPQGWRYILDGLPHVSYTEYELIKVDPPVAVLQEVREIIDHKTVGRKKYYKVWWRGELKKQATWELAKNLIEDGLEDYIQFYENKRKK